MWIFQKYFWRLYEQLWIDVHWLKQLMFWPIRAVFGQDIAAYAHVKRPDSAYKEAFVFFRCQYLSISVYMCQYLCISVHIQQRITWATKNRVHAFWRLCLYWITHGKGPSDWSLRSNVVVCRPNHGPWVDVKEAAARSRLAISVTDAMLIACCLPVSHGVRDRPSISSGHKRQSAQDVGERDHVHHRVRVWTAAWHVEHLSSNMGSTWPPQTCLPWAIVPQSLNHGTFALLQAARISTNMDGE